MKHAFRLSRARAALVALAAVAVLTAAARAQTLSPSPDTAIFQITSATPLPATPTPTPTPTPSPTPVTPVFGLRDSFAGDISGNGRFVVIESSADIATNRSDSRNNADGNQEIFLFDYAQRRIFQITNTKSALKNTAVSPLDATNIDVVIVNLKPSISRDGKFIVFQSNAYIDANTALTPFNFDGQANAAALKTDGNTEIFIYALPAYPEVSDLSAGTEVPEVNLLAAAGMTRVTTTAATSLPRPASGSIITAFFALDNYDPVINDDGSLIAFVSKARTGNIGGGNADGNKEIFVVKNPRVRLARLHAADDDDGCHPGGEHPSRRASSSTRRRRSRPATARSRAASPTSRTPTRAPTRRRPTAATAKSSSPRSTTRRAPSSPRAS